jgi:hypothetical protein
LVLEKKLWYLCPQTKPFENFEKLSFHLAYLEFQTTLLFRSLELVCCKTGHALGIMICGCSLLYKRDLWASKSAGAHSTY